MKFLLLSDIHGTNKNPVGRQDDIFKAFDKKFSFILNYSEKHKIPILQAGDFLDSSRNWDILGYMLKKLKNRKTKIYSIFGQHDLYMRRYDNVPSTLQTLIEVGYIKKLNKLPLTVDDCHLYGSSWKEPIPKPVQSKKKNVLVLHKSISTRQEYPDQDFTSAHYFLRKNKEYNLILVGDIHKQFVIRRDEKRLLVNTGPLLRMEASKYNFAHTPRFYIWDSEDYSLKRIKIPHEPSEKILSREHIDKANISKKELEIFTNTLNKMGTLKDVRKNKIKKYLKKHIANKRVRKIVEDIVDGQNRCNEKED